MYLADGAIAAAVQVPHAPLERCTHPEVRRVMFFFAVALPKSSHEELIPFVIASNRFPARETAHQQISASVRNVSKPAICNYGIHWGIRTNGTQKLLARAPLPMRLC